MHLAVDIYTYLVNARASNEAVIFIIGMLPIAELRGAIPIGILLLKENTLTTVIWAYLGNVAPVPLLLFLFQPVSRSLSRFSLFRIFFKWLFDRTTKRAHHVERFGALGLMLFVAVPLPVTGAWTGCIAATLFRIRFRYACIAICLGVAMAAAVVTLLVISGRLGAALLAANN
ncbi:MAG: small multi-drug export protein [Candidatus Omnitrophica bacterium]|nr:small multi-drug export protein [Candidatus Omnitrophota bacterium]